MKNLYLSLITILVSSGFLFLACDKKKDDPAPASSTSGTTSSSTTSGTTTTGTTTSGTTTSGTTTSGTTTTGTTTSSTTTSGTTTSGTVVSNTFTLAGTSYPATYRVEAPATNGTFTYSASTSGQANQTQNSTHIYSNGRITTSGTYPVIDYMNIAFGIPAGKVAIATVIGGSNVWWSQNSGTVTITISGSKTYIVYNNVTLVQNSTTNTTSASASFSTPM